MNKVLLVGLLAASATMAAPVIEVIPTLGPSFTSPHFASWAANVINSIRTGTAFGGGVSAYVPLTNGASLTGGEFIDTEAAGFYSWMGAANPPFPFNNEFGTTLYFSVKITDPGVDSIRLSDVTLDETYLGSPYGASPIGGTYRSTAVGVDTANNVLSEGENATTAVSSLYYVGAGFFVPLLSSLGSEQAMLDDTRATIQALEDRTTKVCYSIGAQTSCGLVLVQASSEVPEPASGATVGAMIALGWVWSRRTRRS